MQVPRSQDREGEVLGWVLYWEMCFDSAHSGHLDLSPHISLCWPVNKLDNGEQQNKLEGVHSVVLTQGAPWGAVYHFPMKLVSSQWCVAAARQICKSGWWYPGIWVVHVLPLVCYPGYRTLCRLLLQMPEPWRLLGHQRLCQRLLLCWRQCQWILVLGWMVEACILRLVMQNAIIDVLLQ